MPIRPNLCPFGTGFLDSYPLVTRGFSLSHDARFVRCESRVGLRSVAVEAFTLAFFSPQVQARFRYILPILYIWYYITIRIVIVYVIRHIIWHNLLHLSTAQGQVPPTGTVRNALREECPNANDGFMWAFDHICRWSGPCNPHNEWVCFLCNFTVFTWVHAQVPPC